MQLQDIKQEYRREYKGTWIYTIYPGRWQVYNHETDMPGVTIKYRSGGLVSTIVYCDNLKRAEELQQDLERNRERTHTEQRVLGEYIRNNKLY